MAASTAKAINRDDALIEAYNFLPEAKQYSNLLELRRKYVGEAEDAMRACDEGKGTEEDARIAIECRNYITEEAYKAKLKFYAAVRANQ